MRPAACSVIRIAAASSNLTERSTRSLTPTHTSDMEFGATVPPVFAIPESKKTFVPACVWFWSYRMAVGARSACSVPPPPVGGAPPVTVKFARSPPPLPMSPEIVTTSPDRRVDGMTVSKRNRPSASGLTYIRSAYEVSTPLPKFW